MASVLTARLLFLIIECIFEAVPSSTNFQLSYDSKHRYRQIHLKKFKRTDVFGKLTEGEEIQQEKKIKGKMLVKTQGRHQIISGVVVYI